MASLTQAQKDEIKALRLPAHVDRWADVKMASIVNTETGQTEKKPVVDMPLPVRLRRKDVKRIKAKMSLRHRVPFVEKDTVLEIDGGQHPSGRIQKTFFRVVKAGSLVVREAFDRRTRKAILSLGGTAVLAPETDLTLAFDAEFWKDEK